MANQSGVQRDSNPQVKNGQQDSVDLSQRREIEDNNEMIDQNSVSVPNAKKRKIQKFMETESSPERDITEDETSPSKSSIRSNGRQISSPDDMSVDTIERRLFKALKECRLIQNELTCNFSRCGRTDRGVHADGNYVALNLRLQKNGEEYDYVRILNNLLPVDIRIIKQIKVDGNFDARFDSMARIYKYFFFYTDDINFDRMEKALPFFEGAHDFRNFCKQDPKDTNKNYRRHIYRMSLNRPPPGNKVAHCTIIGSAFLWHQVRCMMGILLEIGKGVIDPISILNMLDVQKFPIKPTYSLAVPDGLVLADSIFSSVSPESHLSNPEDILSSSVYQNALSVKSSHLTDRNSAVSEIQKEKKEEKDFDEDSGDGFVSLIEDTHGVVCPSMVENNNNNNQQAIVKVKSQVDKKTRSRRGPRNGKGDNLSCVSSFENLYHQQAVHVAVLELLAEIK